MANKIDLTTLAKEYAEGRISKEDFLYLHNMLSNPPANQPAAPVAAKPKPPVLKPEQPARPATPPPKRQFVDIASAARQSTARTTPHNTGLNTGTSGRGMSPAVVIPPAFGRDSAKSGAVLGYVRRHHKEVVALLGTLGIFISMFYNKFQTPPPDRGTTRVVMVKQAEDKAAPQLHSQKIKLVAQLLMDDNSWNKELIKDFVVQWNKLSDSEKALTKQTDWFYDFSSKLSQQIKTAKTKAKTGDVQAIYTQQALLSLADSLIFGDDRSMKELLAQTAQSNSAEHESTAAEAKKPEEHVAVSHEEATARPETAKQESTQVAVIDVKPTHVVEPAPIQSVQGQISRSDVEKTLSQLTASVEDGNMKQLAALFADDDFSNRFDGIDQVLNEYRDLFATTRERNLNFNNLNWNFEQNDAYGKARYLAQVKMKSANVNKDISGDLEITLHRQSDKLYITNFKLSNKKIVASVSRPNKSQRSTTPTLARKEKPKHPTQAELQDLVTQYVSAYETGDVNNMMRLFANATWSTGKNGMIEMKQTYQNLFSSTSGREVFIKNVQWRYKDDKAMGTGDLVITMRDNENKVQTQKGKIRLVAERSKNSVQITQMFHIIE